MGSSDQTQSPNLKLSLYSLPQEPPLGMPTPPRKNAASIPFQWEEAPGKPRPCMIRNPETQKTCLDLPPRMLMLINNDAKLMSNLPSPTTVLDGPYNYQHVHGSKSLSFRKMGTILDGKEKVAFRSCRWGNLRDDEKVGGDAKVKITRVRRRGSFWGTRSSLLVTLNSML